MFGEDLSESPRVPSPWDNLISTPPSPSTFPVATRSLVPKLVPEAEEGNVEYKLQLLSPSPARFARLVTQMKWRLLEGGGQAYYELGVADSGDLVGLPRVELEQSLETLEEMAGEIGASVIVVKEIEVPATMSGVHTDRWNAKRGKIRIAGDNSASEYEYSTATTTGTSSMTETETELSTDVEEDSFAVIDGKHAMGFASFPQSKSSSLSSLALFSMEPEDPADNADAEETDHDGESPRITKYAVDLEISSVFKPRPTRRRETQPVAVSIPPIKLKRRTDHKSKKPRPAHLQQNQNNTGHSHMTPSCAEHSQSPPVKPPKQSRRFARDRRREERRKALLMYATSSLEEAQAQYSLNDAIEPAIEPTAELVSGLASLHVSLEPSSVSDELISSTVVDDTVPEITLSVVQPDEDDDGDDTDVFANPFTPTPFSTGNGHSPLMTNAYVGPDLVAGGATRLIVEALVVRKISFDEAFLDFGGFH